MCSGAIVLARISRVVFGASDPQIHFVAPGVKVRAGVLAGECTALLRDFSGSCAEDDRIDEPPIS